MCYKALQRYQLKQSSNIVQSQIEGPNETKLQRQNTISLSLADDVDETYEEDFENPEEEALDQNIEFELDQMPKSEQKNYENIQAEKEIDSKAYSSDMVESFIEIEVLCFIHDNICLIFKYFSISNLIVVVRLISRILKKDKVILVYDV